MEGSSAVTAFVLIVGMILPLVVLAVVCWIFLRAKRRDEAAQTRGEWTNARSS
jgi:hypothetical protein